VPHEWNFRLHPENQRAVLAAIYQEVGFARSLLAYELADGRLKLIDGHLRRDMDPDMEVDVEILVSPRKKPASCFSPSTRSPLLLKSKSKSASACWKPHRLRHPTSR
jgi:hypothetical protein